MKDLKTIKYIIIAAGVIASAAFYVMSGEGPAMFGYEKLEELSADEPDSGPESEAKESPIKEASPDTGNRLSEKELEEIRILVREAVREELLEASKEGYLETALDQAVRFQEEVAKAHEGMVDLNLAPKEELMTLPGIGEKRAEDIIAYRNAHGQFKSIEDVMQVNGIKDAAFQKIRDKIYV